MSKTCPQCRSAIHQDARKCPHCRSKQPTDRRLLYLIGGVFLIAAIANSGEDDTPATAEAAETTVPATSSSTASASTEKLGPTIDVWSDLKATYTDEGSGVLPNGNLWIISRRSGPSGISFSKREVDCENEQFAYRGEGETKDTITAGFEDTMGDLTEGSISTLVSDYVCRKHGRGGVRGV